MKKEIEIVELYKIMQRVIPIGRCWGNKIQEELTTEILKYSQKLSKKTKIDEEIEEVRKRIDPDGFMAKHNIRSYENIERIKTKKIPIELEFKKKDGTKVKMKAIKIVEDSPTKTSTENEK